jgi:hypothetical protein
MQMPTLSPVYLPYKDGTRSVKVVKARQQMPTLSPVYLPYKDGKRSVEVVTARHANADIKSCLAPVQGRDTAGGSGDSRCKWLQRGMRMPTLSPVYLPYKDGTWSVKVVTARLADADIDTCLSPVQGRDTVGGSGNS